ncbi:hypothetical protein Y1Q_0005203 [Alligator mississippiensis]|uniref:Uncharacterized protein n=1 Tax=Alligator mississippiensis TaxID=8496 RepID=A0A151MT03_ALLMI|nr:hypothetical protein Y1Q_0005203 [Alligator mississippiensis]
MSFALNSLRCSFPEKPALISLTLGRLHSLRRGYQPCNFHLNQGLQSDAVFKLEHSSLSLLLQIVLFILVYFRNKRTVLAHPIQHSQGASKQAH